MKNKIFKITAAFAAITLLSKCLGLLRDSMLAKTYGASRLTDAYYVAITTPTFFYQVFGASLLAVFIPYFKEKIFQSGREEGYNFTNKVITLMLMIMTVMSLIVFMNSYFIARLFAPKLSTDTLLLASDLMRVTIFNMVFMIVSNISCGILQSQNEFLSTSLMGIMLNLPVLLYLFLMKKPNIYMLAFMTGIGFTLQILIQLPYLRRVKYRFRFNFHFRDNDLKRLALSIAPMLVGIGVQQISVLVDKIMGSSLEQGTITILNYSSKLNSVTYAVFATAILTTAYPQLANLSINKDYNGLTDKIAKTITYLNLIMIPICLLILIFRSDVITVLFQRGSFNSNDTIRASIAFGFFISGLPFLAMRDLCGNAFYSLKNTKTPASNGIIAVLLNIVLNIVLTPLFGIAGITLATSVSLVISSSLLLYRLKSKFKFFDIRRLAIDFVKIVISAVCMLLVIYLIEKGIHLHTTGKILLIIKDSVYAVFGMMVYLILVKLLKVSEIDSFLESKFAGLLRKLKLKSGRQQ